MTTEEIQRTICNVVDYKTEIEPYPLVKIYSGVGSGKSYFAGKMITGSKEYDIPAQNVLIITSRRAKVKETLKELGVLATEKITKNGNLSREIWETGEDRPYEYERYLKEIPLSNEIGEFTYLTYNKSVVCTNAFISAYLRYIYDPNDPITHIWNKFDAIIVDEVHSLVTDSTYQSSTYDVLTMIQEYLDRYQNNQLLDCACKRIILMTGTPQPFKYFANIDFPEDLTNTLELFDKCNNVMPKNIILLDDLSAKRKIQELLANNEKVLYFTNRTLTETEAKTKFNLPDVKIGATFSNKDKKKLLTPEERKKIKELDDKLEASFIPDDIQFFITTSRNKEGINIQNADIKNMFVETHLMYDVVQMAGRVRKGIDNLYIISNAEQHDHSCDVTNILFSKRVMVANKDTTDSTDKANIYLDKYYLSNYAELQKDPIDRRINIMNYVKYIEERFAYIKFNMFKQKFEFFDIKESAEMMAQTNAETTARMVFADKETFNDFFARWFPGVYARRELSPLEHAKKHITDLFGDKEFIRVNKNELNSLVTKIKTLLNSDLKSALPILHLVDENLNYKLMSTDSYLLFYGEKVPLNSKRRSMGKRTKC